MIVLFHRGGPVPCYQPAIGVRAMPSRNEIAADNVVRLDGTTPARGDPMICGSCRQPVIPAWLFRAPDTGARGG